MDIDKEIEEVLNSYKYLSFDENNKILFGKIYISKYDYYEVKIVLENYPRLFPTVYEVDDRIPKKMKRHIYTDTGACCFTTRAKSQILLGTKITSLYVFIKEIVVKYFENNSYFEINKKYFEQEYSHDSLGIYESYQDILGIKNANLIAKLMFDRINSKKLTIRDLCYCQSGVTLKKCSRGNHVINYRLFRMIDKDVIEYDLQHHIFKYIKIK